MVHSVAAGAPQLRLVLPILFRFTASPQTSQAEPSNEQGRGRDHNPRNERGQAGEQQKIVQDYVHGSLPDAGHVGVIPQA
jgi:hypothetical protein